MASRIAKKGRKSGELEPAERANQVGAIDFKGWCRTGDGARCEPLTISDQATHYLLCCQALSSTRTELVRPVMERVYAEYGLSERIRSDNDTVRGERGVRVNRAGGVVDRSRGGDNHRFHPR
jgi:hypothetical protein